MKTLIPILIGLLLVGCDRSLTEEERKLVGCYEKIIRLPDGSAPHSFTNKLVLFENGKVESYENGKWGGHFRFATEWNKVKKEVHVFENPNTAAIFKIEPNGDLTYFSEINLGMRVDMPKKYHDTFKKTSEKPKPRKVVPANIGNPILEKKIREELNKPKGEFTNVDLEKVTGLRLYNKRMRNVNGIEKLTQLKILYLPNNQLTHVKDLENLTQLSQLDLENNRLTDVKGLEKLTQLYFLSLSGNRMTDVKGLEKLPKLHTLKLDDNQLTEVPKGLEKLTQLTNLDLTNNQLTSVKGLEKLPKLHTLKLDDNKLTAVKGLEKLTQLTDLGLTNNQLTSVKGLEKLPKLGALNLGANKLTEFPEGLEKLTQLKRLWLDNNPDLTKAQIAELQKALPSCNIYRNRTK